MLKCQNMNAVQGKKHVYPICAISQGGDWFERLKKFKSGKKPKPNRSRMKGGEREKRQEGRKEGREGKRKERDSMEKSKKKKKISFTNCRWVSSWSSLRGHKTFLRGGPPLQMCDTPKGSPVWESSDTGLTPHLKPFQLLARLFVNFTLRQSFLSQAGTSLVQVGKKARGSREASLLQGLTSLRVLYIPVVYQPCHRLDSWWFLGRAEVSHRKQWVDQEVHRPFR